jgi:hypothetical protein
MHRKAYSKAPFKNIAKQTMEKGAGAYFGYF